MTDFSSKTALVWDSGLFVQFAEHLAVSFGQVFYFSDVHNGPFPTDAQIAIGVGLPGVIRTDDPFEVIRRVPKEDLLIVFPDVYQGGNLQKSLREEGYRVWGTATADRLELDRVFAKETMADVGIDIGPYRVVKGVSALCDALKASRNPDGVFVKLRHGRQRGNFETFPAKSWDYVENRVLFEIAPALGMRAETTEFILEKPIRPACELGGDFHCVDGQYPSLGVVGLEAKGEAWVGKVMKVRDMPVQITEPNEKLAAYLKANQLRNLFALESRIKDGVAYGLDPCCRFSRPCSEALTELIDNWPEIMWDGAEGICVDATYKAKYAAQLMFHCDVADKVGLTICDEGGHSYGSDMPSWIKLANGALIRKKRTVLPGLTGVAAVVGMGPTMGIAVAECKQRAELVTGDRLRCSSSALDQAVTDWGELGKFGVNIK